MRVWEQAPNGHRMNVADPNFGDFLANNTFAELAEYSSWPSSVTGGSEPARVEIAQVSRGFLQALGVEPFQGRGFLPEEERLHGSPAAIVSYAYWQRYLGRGRSAFQLRTEGAVYAVVGVMPRGFNFPAGVAVWMTRTADPDHNRTAHNWRVIGRVRAGVTVAQGARRSRRHCPPHPATVRKGRRSLAPPPCCLLPNALVGDVRTALLTLLATVALLLLVACANVAGLLLARTSARRRELAIRAALGAGCARLVRQFLAESFLLSFAGGAFGIAIAAAAVRDSRRSSPPTCRARKASP